MKHLLLILFLTIHSISYGQPVGFPMYPTAVSSCTFTPVSSTSAQSTVFTGSFTTTAINASAANIVIVPVNTFTTTTTFTDNGGHTWTHVSGALQGVSPGTQYSDVFYCVGSFSSSLTITISNVSAVAVMAFSCGNTTTPVDVAGTGTASTSATSVTTSTITPAASGELLISVGACGNPSAGFGAPTTSVGVTVVGSYPFSAGIAYASGFGYQILSGTSGVSGTWNYGGITTTGTAATVVIFKKNP